LKKLIKNKITSTKIHKNKIAEKIVLVVERLMELGNQTSFI
jgi:chromosome condensin MukBEF MukE localization factor